MLQHFSCEQNADLISWSEMILALFYLQFIFLVGFFFFFFFRIYAVAFFKPLKNGTQWLSRKKKKNCQKKKKLSFPPLFHEEDACTGFPGRLVHLSANPS